MKSTLKRLDAAHKRLVDTVSAVDPRLLSQRPSENQWSIAEVVQHLCLVEERVLSEFKTHLELPPARVGFWKRLIPARIVTLRLVKVEAPKATRPSSPPPALEELLKSYDRRRAQLKELCIQEGRERLRNIRLKRPLLGDIDGLAAIAMLGFHEQRHLKQIREILKKLEHPSKN